MQAVHVETQGPGPIKPRRLRAVNRTKGSVCCVPRRLRHQRSRPGGNAVFAIRPCVRDCSNTTPNSYPTPAQQTAGGPGPDGQPASHQGDETANPRIPIQQPTQKRGRRRRPPAHRQHSAASAAPPSASAPSPRNAAGHETQNTPRSREIDR